VVELCGHLLPAIAELCQRHNWAMGSAQ